MIARTRLSHITGNSPMRSTFPMRALCAALALSFLAGCSDDDNDNGGTSPNVARTYNQVERLGNPLVSEVFFAKRDHGLHNSTAPASDSANGFRLKIK
ncbi:MAG TPA: hypothetical protein VE861_05285, partial [Gemmatimonadaceae bacterium]|nr:hypothetical protein [Gemmatimonadaceae bacterium]